MRPAHATLEKIAEISGLSRSTVSRALARHPDVSEETREIIKEVAKSIGYQPDWAAQSLARGRSNLVAMVLPGTGEMWTSELAVTAAKVIYADHYLPVSFPTNGHVEWETSLLEVVKSQRPAGVLWLPCLQSQVPETVNAFASRKIPLIVVDRHDAGCPATFVYTDDRNGIGSAVRHVVEQGHRRIALIVGPMSGTMRLRKESFLEAIANAHIAPQDTTIVEAPLKSSEPCYQRCYDVAREMLGRKDRPTAILTCMDEQAWGCLEAARDMGIAVPQELRIIGYGNYIPAHFTRCRLSTVVQDREKIVVEAINALLGYMRDDYEPKYRSIIVPTSLLIRDT